MNFIISSSELYAHLQSVKQVINSKNSLPILDNFLFQIEKKNLQITASDLESTLITNIELSNVEGEGMIAIEAKRLSDILKEFSEQPLTFNIDTETFSVEVLSQNGKFSLIGQNGNEFPKLPTIKEGKGSKIQLSAELLLNGINKTIFATAEDELRPVMNGIFIEISPEEIRFVSTDAHKLVRYKRFNVSTDITSSFILPKKPASLLKNLIAKGSIEVEVEFDEKNAFFNILSNKLICRLVEGNYPAYNAVIPIDNPNKLTVDRVELINSLKRVTVFSNQATNLVRLQITGNQLTISAQDIDFSISAVERIPCTFEGEAMEIGFKSLFLMDILLNLSSTEVCFELSDPTRAGIILPANNENKDEDILMLIMPMMLNDN
ncbi:MAG: DNA polymerase III subunit beta [Bacteroidetes bacterium CG02_land_8_20_14_3_00_31_25]|nr:DNA polymerase III subunit beta [Bacteroidota bacterium]PIV58865.1 MAG: DNA polymerase III subunit beta [Bacteroidetes bacterium CG02_land_8_20_14_3_00_31_25]PIX36432.1 MAG: DNA polymerase III subunit beta [Bacteroidetes bacterium CG_4_8_14_3_um_filter_31_14]PIY06606.1 MAG: DNA polymerase III subunit beta [Bacteroidetes bacterium CG_4_10_14_3_um_filter_31_20]